MGAKFKNTVLYTFTLSARRYHPPVTGIPSFFGSAQIRNNVLKWKSKIPIFSQDAIFEWWTCVIDQYFRNRYALFHTRALYLRKSALYLLQSHVCSWDSTFRCATSPSLIHIWMSHKLSHVHMNELRTLSSRYQWVNDCFMYSWMSHSRIYIWTSHELSHLDIPQSPTVSCTYKWVTLSYTYERVTNSLTYIWTSHELSQVHVIESPTLSCTCELVTLSYTNEWVTLSFTNEWVTLSINMNESISQSTWMSHSRIHQWMSHFLIYKRTSHFLIYKRMSHSRIYK